MRTIGIICLLCTALSLIFYVYYTQTYNREDRVVDNVSDSLINDSNKYRSPECVYTETGYTWQNNKGEEYPVYLSYTGSCFIIKKTKSGEEYRAYLAEEVSEQIRNNPLNQEKEKHVPLDTIYSFMGKTVVLNNKICEQISAIAVQDSMLSYHDSIIQIGEVRWHINLQHPKTSIILYTSVDPDMPSMKNVIRYLNSIYGEPYEDEADGCDIKWSSSKDPNDIFNGECTLVHMRRVHSEEGGTFLFFN